MIFHNHVSLPESASMDHDGPLDFLRCFWGCNCPKMLHVWNMYQHLLRESPSHVRKYTIYMEHMGVTRLQGGAPFTIAQLDNISLITMAYRLLDNIAVVNGTLNRRTVD